ncbi:hypothetical protein D3C76_1159220 [compost metagenome]
MVVHHVDHLLDEAAFHVTELIFAVFPHINAVNFQIQMHAVPVHVAAPNVGKLYSFSKHEAGIVRDLNLTRVREVQVGHIEVDEVLILFACGLFDHGARRRQQLGNDAFTQVADLKGSATVHPHRIHVQGVGLRLLNPVQDDADLRGRQVRGTDQFPRLAVIVTSVARE